MAEQCLYHWALWLETIGFFTTAVIVFFVKWQAMKHINNAIKSFIVKLPKRLFKLFEPIVWLLSHLATEGGKIPQDIAQQHLPAYRFKFILWTAIIAPILLILLAILVIPIYIIAGIAKLLSGHNAITNMLIGLGTCMILAGLIIELAISYLIP